MSTFGVAVVVLGHYISSGFRRQGIDRIPGSALPGTRKPLLPGHAALCAEQRRCESRGVGRFDALWGTRLGDRGRGGYGCVEDRFDGESGRL
jgi:hypothetical protein